MESSAMMKLYRPEVGSDETLRAVTAERVPVTSQLTEIEVRRNFVRHFAGEELASVQRRLQIDLDEFALMSLDADVCADAAWIAEETLCRSLDAIHLAAARRASPNATMLTFDQRQAQAARAIGMAVLGA
ncbi:type II toxin-antitoxin system VapC family toxin [Candidatus Poriferisodalis sp.]|uniref:type II toxin-antitoxin system VapC family toxin n=1 Tax=Candidatus Poriferisodalis sp. TaxID=3101277 RepID=UPI003B58B614